MLLDVCLGNRTSWKILSVLAEAPGKGITRKEIKSLTKIGNKVLSKFLILLEKFNLIISSRIGKTYFYKMNLSNSYYQKILEIIKIEKKELNNPDFYVLNMLREFVYELTNVNIENLRNVMLFGSYAKRTQTKDSDIDIAIILKEKNTNDELLITEITNRINERFKKEIQPHYFTEKEFKESKGKLAREIMIDGIILM